MCLYPFQYLNMQQVTINAGMSSRDAWPTFVKNGYRHFFHMGRLLNISGGINAEPYLTSRPMLKNEPVPFMHIAGHKYYYVAPDRASRSINYKFRLRTGTGPTVEKPVNFVRLPRLITPPTQPKYGAELTLVGVIPKSGPRRNQHKFPYYLS